MPLWTIGAFVEAAQGEGQNLTSSDITGVSIDSRSMGQGDAFFAIKGDRFDGHDFVGKALEVGAACAVVSREKLTSLPSDAERLVIVDDVLDAMRKVGIAARARSDAPIVAVTGSVGKTGTKEALRLALGKSGPTHASVASFNNHWGVPLTLARFPETAQYGVFEIGMNHAGEITPLVKMVRPHVAIITTVEAVHIEFFDSVEGIADAKSEIFLGLEPDGTALINRDNPHYERMMHNAAQAGVSDVRNFGKHEQADCRLLEITDTDGGIVVVASIFGQELRYTIGAPGEHWAMNSLPVLATASLVGADVQAAALALADVAAPQGRGKRVPIKIKGEDALLLDESYNANPASMRAALSVLGQTQPASDGKRIAVLGDMLELGAEGPTLHAALAEHLEAASVDSVFLSGPLMKSLYEALPSGIIGIHRDASADLVPLVIEAVSPGDVVTVKGSLGSKMRVVVDALTSEAQKQD